MDVIYHITNLEYWNLAQAKGQYDFDALESEGFIHCSKVGQVEVVANHIFLGHADLLILEIDQRRVLPEIVYENLEGGEELFPHIYGPLNVDAVITIHELKPGDDGKFSFPPS